MNREERVDKAAKIVHQNYTESNWDEADHGERGWAKGTVRAVLAAFEEANTPTDDEDRAFAWAEYRKDYEPNPAHFGREHVAFFAGWDARGVLRRTVQGEPSDALIEEALVWVGRAWDDGNASGLDGWVGPGRGSGEIDREAQHARTRLVHKSEAALRAAAATGGGSDE